MAARPKSKSKNFSKSSYSERRLQTGATISGHIKSKCGVGLLQMVSSKGP